MRRFLRRLWQAVTAPFRAVGRVFRSTREFFTDEPEDVSVPEAFASAIEHPALLLDHLDELRRRVLSSLIVLTITTGVSFAFVEEILDWLTRPVGGPQALQTIQTTEPAGVFMRIALLSGVTLGFPWLAYQTFAFVAPGLKARSRLTLMLAIPFATLLFLVGMAFTYFIMLPATMGFLAALLDVRYSPTLSSYIGLATSLMFWVGLSFQLPLVAYALAAVGILRAKPLAQQWRLVVVGIAVLAAAVTPTIDPVNMALVMAPMIVLYLLSIVLVAVAEGARLRAGA